MNTLYKVDSNRPSVGFMVTWPSEGNEGGPYHSRILHVPSDESGLTIGRGYDMKCRSPAEILQDLNACDVSLSDSTTISKASSLTGESAKEFIVKNKLEKFEISKLGQRLLFERTYPVIVADVKRICTKSDVVEKYGPCDWDKLNPAIVEILVDLRFRGDYNPTSRTFLQKYVSNNDLEGFVAAMKLASNWINVPADRFKRRNSYLTEALARAVAARKLIQQPLPTAFGGSTMPFITKNVNPAAWPGKR